jgi:hypothetical protein
MMSIRLAKSLTADAQARLLTYQNKYTFDGVEYAPIRYKIIMRLATIDSVATTQMMCNTLQSLGTYAATVCANIDKVHNKFDKNYSQLIARGATINIPIGILFEAYLAVSCHNFKMYICCQQEDYLDGKLTNITHKALMTSAKCKFDWLKTKGLWGAESPDNKKIVAMTTALNALKGQLKLDPKLSVIANEGIKRVARRTQRRTRRILTTNGNRRRMKPGRKSHRRTVRSARKKWASTLTTGVNTTWRGRYTSPPTACWANSTRKNKRRSLRRPTPVPLLLPLQPQ